MPKCLKLKLKARVEDSVIIRVRAGGTARFMVCAGLWSGIERHLSHGKLVFTCIATVLAELVAIDWCPNYQLCGIYNQMAVTLIR